jgi:serine/threonine-protein kinase
MSRHLETVELQQLLEERLSDAEREQAESHLEECASCRAALEQLITPLPALLGAHLPAESSEAADSTRVTQVSLPSTMYLPGAPEVPGFEILEELDRGGMGVVLRARDPDLNRVLAVKVMGEGCRSAPELERRFVEEVQITGQLQHPGIPPVHEIGRLPDGRPFFAMKLIKGRTLDELLRERSAPAADLPRFLGIFQAVCQAVAFAHSKGVIHRDLKPSNVMVGAFGEVQVMDWGLAKVLSKAAPVEAGSIETSAIATVRTGSPGLSSQAGQVMGTPAYMAPEQARGEVDWLDERSDVFGLGAILSVILTGEPPFRGSNRGEVQARAARGELGDTLTRLDGCGADAELVALCKHCLRAERESRPGDAGALAAELTAYLESVERRLRQAELERAQAQVKAAEERKRHKVQLALAAALLLLVVGVGSGAWLWQQQQQAQAEEVARREREDLERQRKGDTATIQAMAEARLLLAQAKAAPFSDAGRFRAALEAARKAKALARTSEASEDVRRQAAELTVSFEAEMDAVARDRRLLAALLEVRAPREGPGFKRDDLGLHELLEPSADEQFRSAFRDWGLDVDATPTAQAAARLWSRSATVVTEVVAALDEWANERQLRGRTAARWQRPAALAQALDDDPGSKRRELRLLLARGRLAQEQALGMLAMALRPVPVPFDAGWGGERARLRKLALAADPTAEPVLWLLTLVRALRTTKEDDRSAENLLRVALRARPREVVLYNTLGKLLEEQGRWEQAVECHLAARAIRPELGASLAWALVRVGRVEEGSALYARLVAQQPDNPWLHCDRGRALHRRGRYQEAEGAFRQALKVMPDYTEAHTCLYVLLRDLGRNEQAEACCREVVRLKPDNSASHNNLGNILIFLRRYDEAEKASRRAIQLEPDHHMAYVNLGLALIGQKRYAEAEAACRQATRLKPDYPPPHTNLGLALHCQGKLRQAEAAYRQVIRLTPIDPTAHKNLGEILEELSRYADAEAAYRQVIRLKTNDRLFIIVDGDGLGGGYRRQVFTLKRVSPALPTSFGLALHGPAQQKRDEAAYRAAMQGLGRVLLKQRKWKDVEKVLRMVIALDPTNASAHNDLGWALAELGNWTDAERQFLAAIQLDPKHAWAQMNLGVVRQRQGKRGEAEKFYVKAFTLDPRNSQFQANLINLVAQQGRGAEVEKLFHEVIALEPRNANAHVGLGLVLAQLSKWLMAEKVFRQALDLDKNNALARQALPLVQRMAALEAKLPALLEGEYRPTHNDQRLGFASLCTARQLYCIAAQLYADAFGDDAKLADDRKAAYRYNAARVAALAGCGRGKDADKLGDDEKARLRTQALDWLRADLARWSKHLQVDKGLIVLTCRANCGSGSAILILPVCGMTKPWLGCPRENGELGNSSGLR